MHTFVAVVASQSGVTDALRRRSRVHASNARAVARTRGTTLRRAAVFSRVVQSRWTNVQVVQLRAKTFQFRRFHYT